MCPLLEMEIEENYCPCLLFLTGTIEFPKEPYIIVKMNLGENETERSIFHKYSENHCTFEETISDGFDVYKCDG